MSKLLVTGSDRLGIYPVVNFLNNLGFRIGYEKIFNVDGFNGWEDNVDGDVSFSIPAFTEKINYSDTIIHLIRNPLDMVRSQMGTDLWYLNAEENPLYKLTKSNANTLFKHSPGLERAVAFVAIWTNNITIMERQRIVSNFFVQKMDGPLSLDVCTILYVHNYDVPQDNVLKEMFENKEKLNFANMDMDIKWSDIKKTQYGSSLEVFAERWGYSYD